MPMVKYAKKLSYTPFYRGIQPAQRMAKRQRWQPDPTYETIVFKILREGLFFNIKSEAIIIYSIQCVRYFYCYQQLLESQKTLLTAGHHICFPPFDTSHR